MHKHRNARPLLIIGGTAQTINTWVGILHWLCKHRNVYIYETRGQGKTKLRVLKKNIEEQEVDLSQIDASQSIS